MKNLVSETWNAVVLDRAATNTIASKFGSTVTITVWIVKRNGK